MSIKEGRGQLCCRFLGERRLVREISELTPE